MALLEGLGINIGYLLVQIGSFLIAFLVLRAWVFKPLMKSVEERKKRIKEGLENAQIAEKARESAEAEAEQILDEARAKASKETMTLSQNAELQAQEIIASAESKAKKIIFDAEQTAIKEKKQILGEAREDMMKIAMAMSHQVIADTMDEKKQRQFLKDFFTGLKHVSKEDFDIFDKNAKEVQIYTALPFLDDELEKITKLVRGYFGDDCELVIKVRPVILGGIKIKAGGKILDASVATRLEEIQEALA